MTKRERVRAAFAHREADRVPKGGLCIDSNLADRLTRGEYPEDYQHFERDLAAPGGGYVLVTCNTLIDAIPEANALAMYRSAG